MTNEEAIASLKALCHTCKFFPTCVNDKPECYRAIEMAIKSLEAWKKVKEEIELNMVSLDGLYSYQKSFHNNCNNVRKECIEIINKHLSEVSE